MQSPHSRHPQAPLQPPRTAALARRERSQVARIPLPDLATRALPALGLVFLCLLGGPAGAADRVRALQGTITGQIQSVTAREITINAATGKTETIPVNQLKGVSFDGEPAKLQSARAAYNSGRYEDCLKALAEIDSASIERELVRDELEFLRAASSGQMALAGVGNPRDAGKLVRDFVKNHPESYHFYPATELFGNLLASVGAYKNALEEYARLESVGWPDYQMRSLVARGRVLRAEGKPAEAQAAYQSVIDQAADATDEVVVAQRLAAQLGLAECLADGGQYDDAVERVRQLIAAAGPEDAEVRSRAYNTLGHCWKKAGRPKDALLAYLHVDLLYFSQPQAHAEALKNLAELWNTVGQPERAAQTLEVWRERYAPAQN